MNGVNHLKEIMNKIPIILDCDPGCDDALAIIIACRHPAIDLRALTATMGNSTVEKTVKNACQICTLLGVNNIPVAAGMAQPIIRKPYQENYVFGELGLEQFGFKLPVKKAVKPEPRHAVNLISDLLMASKGEISFVATGPLSNLAMAMRLEPQIIPKIKQIVLIGGSYEQGNVTPAAEFNIYCDPEAAHIVFSCGRPIVMIGLAITEKVLATPEIIMATQKINNQTAKIAVSIMEFFAKNNQMISHLKFVPVYDPAAIVYLLKPEIYKVKPMHVEIELKDESEYGRTKCELPVSSSKPANAAVVIDLEFGKFWDEILRTLKDYCE